MAKAVPQSCARPRPDDRSAATAAVNGRTARTLLFRHRGEFGLHQLEVDLHAVEDRAPVPSAAATRAAVMASEPVRPAGLPAIEECEALFMVILLVVVLLPYGVRLLDDNLTM